METVLSDEVMLNQDDDLNSDLISYSKICEDIRQTMFNVVDLKCNGKSEEKSDITELRMEGSFNFLSLKQLNRAAQIRCKVVKDRTTEAKHKLDGYNLQLENLQYEISHLHKEITKCLEFRSRHENIPLVPLQEFYETAPAEISNPENTKSDVHKQTLARLDHELEKRKQLADNLERLKKMREGVSEKISAKKQSLQTLAPALENLLKTSLPLQEVLHLPFDYTKTQNDLARLLPRPLFVFYLQAKGYQEACDSQTSVTINGDPDLAKKFKEINESSFVVKGITQDKEDSDSDQEEAEDQDSRHSHRRKKHKSASMDHDGNNDFSGVLACHPLTVKLNVIVAKNGPTLLLTFSYLTTLDLVMVKTQLKIDDQSLDKDLQSSSLLEESALLCCTLENDFGLRSPNQSTSFLLHKSTVDLKDVFTKLGRPYSWAQNLCGLLFLPNKILTQGEDMQISFNHIQGTVKALRKKVISRLHLARQIDQFSKNIVTYNGSEIIELPNKIHSNLVSWSAISLSDYKKLSYTGRVIELGILGDDEEAQCHDYFLATINRGSSVQLDVAVVVFCDYPNNIPLLTLSLQWKGLKTAADDSNLQEMEAEINVMWPRVSTSTDIISMQFKWLMVMLDLYVETECDSDDSSQSPEFTLSKICPRKSRGPSRLKPFFYQAASKTFVHRKLDGK